MIGINLELDRNTQRRLQRKFGKTGKQIREAFTFAFDKHKSVFLGHLRSAASGRILREHRKYAGPLSKAIKAEIQSSARGGELSGRFFVEEPYRQRAELLDKGGDWPKEPGGYMRIPVYDKSKPAGFINNKKRYPKSFFFSSERIDRFYNAIRIKKGKGPGTLRILYVFTKQAKMPEYRWFSATVDEFFEAFQNNVGASMKKHFIDNFSKDGG